MGSNIDFYYFWMNYEWVAWTLGLGLGPFSLSPMLCNLEGRMAVLVGGLLLQCFLWTGLLHMEKRVCCQAGK